MFIFKLFYIFDGMKLFDFTFGDRVRITRTNLTGTVIRVGGLFAIVEVIASGKREPIRIELCRLRHIDSFGQLTIRKVTNKVNHVRNYIAYYLRTAQQ